MKQIPQMKTLAGNQSSPNNLITARAETANPLPRKITAMTNLTPESRKPKSQYQVTAEIADGPLVLFTGRNAWTIKQLVEAGPRGVSSRDIPPGVRLAAHIFNLKKSGVRIETIHEYHKGPFSGTHARYRAISQVTILEESGVAQ